MAQVWDSPVFLCHFTDLCLAAMSVVFANQFNLYVLLDYPQLVTVSGLRANTC